LHPSLLPQATKQAPQFEVSNPVSQYGLPAKQSRRPLVHWHELDTHVAFPPHMFPHVPQLLLSLAGFTQPTPAQHVVPPVHAGPASMPPRVTLQTQRPDPLHVSIEPQLFVQLPHVAARASLRGVSQPLPGRVSQLSKPGLQLPMRHMPPMHDPAAFAGAQLARHAPQWAAVVRTSVSQPSLPLRLRSPLQSRQSCVPAGTHAHRRELHVAFAPHARPQFPQLFGSLRTSMQLPPQQTFASGPAPPSGHA
jgi:hypothetical protein